MDSRTASLQAYAGVINFLIAMIVKGVILLASLLVEQLLTRLGIKPA